MCYQFLWSRVVSSISKWKISEHRLTNRFIAYHSVPAPINHSIPSILRAQKSIAESLVVSDLSNLLVSSCRDLTPATPSPLTNRHLPQNWKRVTGHGNQQQTTGIHGHPRAHLSISQFHLPRVCRWIWWPILMTSGQKLTRDWLQVCLIQVTITATKLDQPSGESWLAQGSHGLADTRLSSANDVGFHVKPSIKAPGLRTPNDVFEE